MSGDRTNDERQGDAPGTAEGGISPEAPTRLAGDPVSEANPESDPLDEKSELPRVDPAADATQVDDVGDGSADVDVNAPTRVVDDAEALLQAPADVSSPEDANIDVEAATELRGQRPVSPQATPRGIEPGDILFGEYEIVEVLGAGGMGQVFRAHHRRLDEFRAIKMMHSELSSKKGANAFFLREAKALLAVRNPAVVHCHDLLSDESGRVYLIMEMIEGISLSDKMREAALTPDEVALLGARLAAGLKAAHAKGVVHRDISPDNIVLPGGNVADAKLIDFGIAKILEEGEGTIVDGFKGKLSYASPEQLGFFGGKIDGRSDFYSLGLVLCAAALGRPLGMGSTVVEAVDARRSLRRVPDEIPVGLRSAIEPLLALDPADRPKFVERLFVAPGASSARLPAVSVEPVRSKPSAALAADLSPAVKWGSMSIGVALLVAIAGYLILGGESGEAPRIEATTVPLREPARDVGRTPESGSREPGPAADEAAIAGAVPAATESMEASAGSAAKPAQQAAVKSPVKKPTRKPVSPLDRVRIAGLLKGAELALEENRLQSPRGDNAYEKYRAVISLDPSNRSAQEGLLAVASRYLVLSKQALDVQDVDKARIYLTRASNIAPQHPGLEAARETLDGASR